MKRKTPKARKILPANMQKNQDNLVHKDKTKYTRKPKHKGNYYV